MFSVKLKEIRKEHGLTQIDLAKKLGVASGTVGNWESGKREPDYERISQIADLFNVSVDWLLGSTSREIQRIPVYGKVAAGIPIEAIENIEDYEEIDVSRMPKGQYIALMIRGNSMEPRMRDGDVVIVRLQDDCETGDTAVMLVNGGDATCKRIKKTPEGIFLISTNPAYDPMFFSNEQIADLPVRTLGKVVELRAKF
ncbi:MAG: helix-turn-helix domain-containing protein [Clostridia bacterium]|nr:helix-turn-helix domain-containing protein [Clostridia bacterium]